MSDAVSDRIAAHVAAFAHGGAVPGAAADAAKLVLLDAFGTMLAASGMSAEPRPFVALAAASGPGPSTIVGTHHTASPSLAALASGSLAHALDFEDAFDRAPGHPNASLVPALIALAQSEGPVAGARFLAALAVGGDLSCRIGLALETEMEAGGWYPPPMVASLGATAGAACLLGLDAPAVRDALSLTLCQSVMPGEIKHSRGTTIRAVREAFPAQAAVLSALLARGGVVGFEQPLEGKAGFYALYAAGDFSETRLLEGLGERFWIDELTFKRWPSCRGTHPFIEIALDLRKTPGFAADAIERIELTIDPVQTMLVEPAARKAAPATAIDAKFSVPFCTALALERGQVGLDDFDAGTLGDRRLTDLAAKASYRVAPGLDWKRGSGGALAVIMTDGTRLEGEVADAIGSPARPLGRSALVEKFVTCAVRAQRGVAEDEARCLAAAILDLESCADVGALLA